MATYLGVNYVGGQSDIVLGADVTAGATSFTITVPTIQTGFGIVNPSGIGIYKCVIESEIIHFTSGAVTAGTQTWTMVRAQEGTTGVIHTAGTVIKLENTAGAWGNALQLSPTAQQTGTANISGAITSGGLLTGTDLAAPHFARHMPDGSDPLTRLANLGPGPGIHNYLAWSCDTAAATGSFAPTAGVVFLTKILTPYAFTINNVDICIATGGTGVTALANCFLGIYDSGGTRRFASADQSSNWNTAGMKTLAVSGGYVVTANDFIYIAMLIGTQSTTTCKPADAAFAQSALATANLTAATYRAAFNGSALTSLPNPTMTLSSNSTTAQCMWAGVK